MTAEPIHTPKDTLPTLLTVGQVATILRVTTLTIRRWISAGDLITHRFGRQLRISEADLQAFIRMRRKN